MPFYPILKAVLMTTAISLSRDRHKMFCLLYFYLWALYALIMPSPSQAGMDWYWFCIYGEVSIILTALILSPGGMTIIIGASVMNLCADSLSLIFPHGFLYEAYPAIIRTGELSQCFALILWSPMVISILCKWHASLLAKGTGQWMRSLLKQVTT